MFYKCKPLHMCGNVSLLADNLPLNIHVYWWQYSIIVRTLRILDVEGTKLLCLQMACHHSTVASLCGI